MSEKFPSQSEGRRVTRVDGGTFRDKAESLSVHRAALLWRNYLVRMQNNVGSYASRGQLLREIQEAAALESREDAADPKHVALVLPPGETAESMRDKLLAYLQRVTPLSGDYALTSQVADRELPTVRIRFLENIHELDRIIAQLQNQGRTSTSVPDILYRQQQLHERELKAADLEGDAAYWEYIALCEDVRELRQKVDELLKPRIEEDI